MSKIIYTHTDEAPMLAPYSFLPIVATLVLDSLLQAPIECGWALA